METDGELSFNCAESVIIKARRILPIDEINTSCMQIASVLGGGIAGSGRVCGAVTGGVMCLGTLHGTSGTELPEEFNRKRNRARDIIGRFLEDFATAWGTTTCRYLRAMDKGERESAGTQRGEKSEGEFHCEEYVQWVYEWLKDYLNQ
jgi:C_GCAxxG_C_C family probable redox protein